MENYRGAAVFTFMQDGREVLVSHLCLNEALAHDPRAARTLINFVRQPLRN
jgi:hypothetical protein